MPNRIFFFALALVQAVFAGSARADDEIVQVSLADVLAMPEAGRKLRSDFRFLPAGQALPAQVQRLAVAQSSHRTMGPNRAPERAYGTERTPEFACRWALLSTLIRLQQQGSSKGANAVIDLVSNHQGQPSANGQLFVCRIGAMTAGVAVKGVYARLDPATTAAPSTAP
ncbi:MAG: hypothetical protein U1E77_03595 [Inhella sp.]